MTKEITKARILQEIQDKFKLRDLEDSVFAFSETVIPTYNIEQHLLKPEVIYATLSVTSADPYMFFSVPDNERWAVHGYNVIFVTGSYKVAGVMVRRYLVDDYIYIDLTKNQTVSYSVNLPKDIILNAKDKLSVYVDDYTSTGDLMLRADVTKEELR